MKIQIEMSLYDLSRRDIANAFAAIAKRIESTPVDSQQPIRNAKGEYIGFWQLAKSDAS